MAYGDRMTMRIRDFGKSIEITVQRGKIDTKATKRRSSSTTIPLFVMCSVEKKHARKGRIDGEGTSKNYKTSLELERRHEDEKETPNNTGRKRS
jgi:hypothetical protein